VLCGGMNGQVVCGAKLNQSQTAQRCHRLCLSSTVSRTEAATALSTSLDTITAFG
jgi:hypothetical protein